MDEFDKLLKEKKTCKNCGWAIRFDSIGTIVCGVWHTTFSNKSLCDNFQTQEQVKEVNRKAGEALKKRSPELFKS